jgi:hypothetical protein
MLTNVDTRNSLVIFTKAAQMLAEADTIQKTHELKDLALTAADWARRKGMGEEAVQYARSYALEAERKMGEMLAATPRAEGARGVGPPIAVTPRNRNTPPTLEELGITKRESAEAQRLAALPQETFEDIRDGHTTLTQVGREQKEATREARRAENTKIADATANPPEGPSAGPSAGPRARARSACPKRSMRTRSPGDAFRRLGKTLPKHQPPTNAGPYCRLYGKDSFLYFW